MAPKKLNQQNYAMETRLLHGKFVTEAWDYTHHVVPPLTTSSSFRLDSAARGAEGFAAIGQRYPDDPGAQPIYVYDRMGEPNNDMLQHVLAAAEEKEVAVTFATGMAAVSAATLFALQKGQEVISHRMIYGCTYSLFTDWFPRFGFDVHFCDMTTPDAFLEHLNDNSRVLYLESPANPTLELLDLEAIMKVVNEINAKRTPENRLITVMDNTFATPFCQRPGKWGVDVVVHSLTKGISGFGTEMGGAVVTQREFQNQLILFRKDFGGTLSPSTAWHIMAYGVSTLTMRMRRQQSTARRVAAFLEEHPDVERVYYPGLESFPQHEIAKRLMVDYDGEFAPGIMIYFTVKADSPEESKARGERMMDWIAKNSYSITLAVSLGQLRTLIEHPGSMTHAAYPAEEQVASGMHPGGIRLAIGVEDPNDISGEIEAALNASKG